MDVKIIKEAGYDEALLGLSLSYGRKPTEMCTVAEKLCNKDGGHNKYLESMCVWIDITAPRYWWQEFDTYRIGTTKQSGSTMHTLKKQPLTNDNFEQALPQELLNHINQMISDNAPLTEIKNILPEGFLQRRIVCTNYKALRHMIAQRKNHRLQEWRVFCDCIKTTAEHKEFLNDL